jgi:hypothetical protein
MDPREELAALRRLAELESKARGGMPEKVDWELELRKQDAKEMGPGERFFASMGQPVADIVRSAKRIGNMVGIGDYTEERAKRDKELEAPITDTTAGKAGRIVGDIALTAAPVVKGTQMAAQGLRQASRLLPKATTAINAAAPYVGAAGVGSATTALLTPEDMAKGAKEGAIYGAGGEALGRVASTAYQGGKALLEPLWQSGRERVLKRTIDRFAQDPNAVRAAAANPEVFVPGATPTLAQASMDPGVAQLERGAMSVSPDVANMVADATGRRVSAYKTALDDLAGNDGRQEFFTAARDRAADELYGQARAGGLQMTRQANKIMQDLMKRPSIQQAMGDARQLALEKGIKIDNPAGSVEGLQFVKKALDDRISAAKTAGNSELASALRDTQEKLLGYLDIAAPAHGEARRTFAAMSQPVNQMAVGQKLRDTMFPPLSDWNPNMIRTRADAYAQALRDPKMASRATGINTTLEEVLDPSQLQTVQGIAKDVARANTAGDLAKVPGSPTAQYMAAQNVIGQILGPLGLPQSMLQSQASKIASGIMGWAYKIPERELQQMLGQALTDPAVASRILAAKDPKTVAEILRPYVSVPAGVVYADQ